MSVVAGDAGAKRSLSFIVFSDDWAEHMSSSQHLFRYIAREHTVVWINTVGMRSPRWNVGDAKKAWRKLSRMWSPARRRAVAISSDIRLTVHQPFMLPFSGFPAIRAFNARNVKRLIVRAWNTLAHEGQTVIVATVPNAGDYCATFKNMTVAYYCVDDFAQWPGLDAKVVRDMERRLIARADVLVAASEKLRERLAASGKPTYLLTHGVDIELFGHPASIEHPCLQSIPKPRVGFFGLIDERVDQRLLDGIALRMPDVSFVLSGPVALPAQRMITRTNVHFTGPIPYPELPQLVRGLEVLFIPYKTGSFADSLSPLKLNEYLITGKPVVSTAIAGVLAHARLVAIAEGVDQWVQALRSGIAAAPEPRSRDVIASMRGESWSCKSQELVNLCARRKSGQPELSNSCGATSR